MLRRSVLEFCALGWLTAVCPLRPAQAAQKTVSRMVRPFNLKEKTVKLNNGRTMPVLGLGTYALHGQTYVRAVRAALDCGVRLIDTASFYGNEREVGSAVRDAVKNGLSREEIFVTTKIYPTQFGNPQKAIEESMSRLDLGYIDLLLLHHPGNGDVAAYRTLEKAVEEGAVRSIGLSNWYIKELTDFLPKVDVIPALVQNEIHPFYQDRDVVPFIQEMGIVVQAWFPFGGRGWTKSVLGHPELAKIAMAHGKTVAQIVLRWNLQRNVSAIPGSSNPAHIKENTEIFDLELSDSDMKAIAALDRHEKHEWY